MKLKFVCAVAASIAFLAGSANAESNDQQSQRYQKNNSNASAQKVKQNSDRRFDERRNMNLSNESRHPIHTKRMGGD